MRRQRSVYKLSPVPKLTLKSLWVCEAQLSHFLHAPSKHRLVHLLSFKMTAEEQDTQLPQTEVDDGISIHAKTSTIMGS